MNLFYKKPTFGYVTISPYIAAQMLMANKKNRNINRNYVASLARDMRAGNWQDNGDSIRFGKDGVLLDGQHRLTAIVQSQVSIECLVIKDIDNEAMQTIDSGRKRTYGDRLAINGIKNAGRYSATINMLSWLCGHRTGLGGQQLTNAELDQVRLAHPNLYVSIEKTHKVFPKVENLIGALHYVASFQGLHEDAEAFVEVWRNGQASYPSDAALFTREWLIKDNAKMRSTNLHGRQYTVIDGFRKFLKRKPMRGAKRSNSYLVPNFTKQDLFMGKAE